MGFDFSIRIQQFIWLDERSLVSEKTIILFYLKPDILQKSNRQVKAYGRNVWFETSFCYSFWSTQICELCRINKPRQYKYVSEILNVIFSWWQFLTHTSNSISFLFSLCLSLFLWTENRILHTWLCKRGFLLYFFKVWLPARCKQLVMLRCEWAIPSAELFIRGKCPILCLLKLNHTVDPWHN